VHGPRREGTVQTRGRRLAPSLSPSRLCSTVLLCASAQVQRAPWPRLDVRFAWPQACSAYPARREADSLRRAASVRLKPNFAGHLNACFGQYRLPAQGLEPVAQPLVAQALPFVNRCGWARGTGTADLDPGVRDIRLRKTICVQNQPARSAAARLPRATFRQPPRTGKRA
jgi:hypothetical protein